MAIDALRRFFLPCFFPATAATTSLSSKKNRPSTSTSITATTLNSPSSSTSSSSSSSSATSSAKIPLAPPRPSKSMVIGTIFGNRRGHVWFSVQHDRLSLKPLLLLELPISTNSLVREMRSGLLRIALECSPSSPHSPSASCPLRSVPLWTAFCNGRKAGFSARRRAGHRVRSILRTMHCITVGAGVIPAGSGSAEELMYMRANFEHMVGNADSESFHLINPDECPGQELSVFLLRSRLGVK